METLLYQVNSLFARENKIPTYFIANKLIETPKALYLYGTGTLETQKMGVCCVCGRILTHPVSIELGIGPECGEHYWDWDLVGDYSIENQKRLISEMKIKIAGIKVDGWFPKTCVKETLPTESIITTPADHPMLKPREIAPKLKLASYLEDNKIKIQFPFDMELMGKVKELPDRKYNPEGKYWVCPVSLSAIERLQSLGFILDTFLSKFYEKSQIKVDIKTIKESTIPGLKGLLFPFQSKGVSFIEAKGGRALIADEMGLGKTVQALAWLQLHPEHRPAIIVVPASLKLNWKKEAENWLSDPNVEILSGTTPWKTVGDILVINYDILANWVDTLKAIKPPVLIMDECHYIKNSSAKRTKALKTLSKGINHVIGLSGTPIMNRPVEIDNAIRIIDPTILPSFWHCAHKFYGAHNNGYGWQFDGATNTDTFHKLLTESIMIRRKKADVLTDLPDKIYSFLPLELDNEKDYRSAENNFINFVKETKGQIAAIKASNAQALVEIEGLKQLAVKGKLKASIEWITDFLESDQKLVVFASHKFVIDELMQAFPGITVKIDGSVGNTERQVAVDRFQNDPKIRLFVGNIQAAGVGITLTAASNVAFLELPWTPGALSQAADRCHRIGQKENVMIHYLLATGTIEEKIASMLDSKLKVLNRVLDGIDTPQESLLSELINEYK